MPNHESIIISMKQCLARKYNASHMKYNYLLNQPVTEDTEVKNLTKRVAEISNSTEGVHVNPIDLK